jgi:hypothetical protein
LAIRFPAGTTATAGDTIIAVTRPVRRRTRKTT